MARSDAGHGFPFSHANPHLPVKQKIITYLEGPRNLAEGIALVLAHSRNVPLIRTLQRRRQDIPYAGAVFEELRKMAGLTPFAFAHMKRYAKRPPEEETKTNGLSPSRIYIDEIPNASQQWKRNVFTSQPNSKKYAQWAKNIEDTDTQFNRFDDDVWSKAEAEKEQQDNEMLQKNVKKPQQSQQGPINVKNNLKDKKDEE